LRPLQKQGQAKGIAKLLYCPLLYCQIAKLLAQPIAPCARN